MSDGVLSHQRAEPRLRGLVLLISVLAVATVACTISFNGNPLLSLLPVLASVTLYTLWRVPIRVPLMVMMFIGLTFENPGDVPADHRWQSPLYELGKLLLAQLKHSIPMGGLVMTGSDLILALLVIIYFCRRIAGSDIDRRNFIAAPRPLRLAALACIGGAAAMWLWGAARGGENRFALWQFHHIVYLPVMFLFMQVAVPGGDKSRGFARLIIAAACLKAVVALYVRSAFPDAEYATTHHDSMLFAAATCLTLIHVLEVPGFRPFLRAVPLITLLVMGMVANDRRLVWVQIGLAVIFMFLMARRTKLKVTISRGILYALPVLAVYVAVGWGSGSGVFAPVGTLRSMVDSEVDKSSEWRDLENFNLVSTLKQNPLAGVGFGHPFEMAVKLPDVIKEYELEPYLPHNSLVGIWAYTGYVGFSLIWTMLALTCYFAARAYRFAADPDDRTAAMTSFSIVVVYMVHCYGDMGLGTWTSIYLVSLAMVLAGKTAVKVGAWPGLARPVAAPPPPLDVAVVPPRRLGY